MHLSEVISDRTYTPGKAHSLMKNGALVLIPADHRYVPGSMSSFIDLLAAVGLIGLPLSPKSAYDFQVGTRFLELVTFLGCSPFIELAPPKTGEGGFCHVRLASPRSTPEFIDGGLTNRHPRCGQCRNPLPQWRDVWEARDSDPGEVSLTCPSCGTGQSLIALHWPKDTGFARFHLLIENVFPGEAVPVPELMALLKESTGCEWRYLHLLR